MVWMAISVGCNPRAGVELGLRGGWAATKPDTNYNSYDITCAPVIRSSAWESHPPPRKTFHPTSNATPQKTHLSERAILSATLRR